MSISRDIHETFGEIDIYVFDQLLKGRFDSSRRVLDAGCGEGRNLQHLMMRGCECFGIDRTPDAIAGIRALAASVAPHLPPGNFVTGEIDDLPWPDAAFDSVICSAVLHFARDEAHFDRMVREMWRVLAPGGLFIARLGSIYPFVPQGSQMPAAGTRLRSPDGADRFLVDAPMLLAYTNRLGGALLDPIKTTVVHAQRAMTTWVMRKG
jgi:SAM-dependent methyltransferase